MLGDENNSDVIDLDEVDPRTCALLIIDETDDPSGGPLEDTLLAPTLNTARIARVAREHDVPVIFADDAHIEGLDRELELWGNHCLAGTAEAQPSPQLEQQPGDYVIEKRRYSAFFQTGLRLLLDELGVQTLVLCGFDTNICVAHTAADAYFNNYGIIVVGDATGTFLVGDQDEGLDYMKTCYAAKIISTDEACELLGG